MIKREARAPSQRQLKVGEELRHALAWTLERGKVRDPVVHDARVTVTEVRISSDLKNATAFVTPLGGGEREEAAAVIQGVNRAAPYLRRRMAQAVRLKFVPKVSFHIDTSFDEASHIDNLLNNPAVIRDLEPGGSRGDGEDGT